MVKKSMDRQTNKFQDNIFASSLMQVVKWMEKAEQIKSYLEVLNLKSFSDIQEACVVNDDELMSKSSSTHLVKFQSMVFVVIAMFVDIYRFLYRLFIKRT